MNLFYHGAVANRWLSVGLLLLTLVIGSGFWYWRTGRWPLQNEVQQSPTATPEPAPSEVPFALPHCADEAALSQITGLTLSLIRETQLPEGQVVQCSYAAAETVDSVLPSLSYTLSYGQGQAKWDAEQQTQSTQSGYRRIEEKPTYFAVVNPVYEVAQIMMYGYRDKWYVELNLSPVRASTGDMLNAGVKLLDQILTL